MKICRLQGQDIELVDLLPWLCHPRVRLDALRWLGLVLAADLNAVDDVVGDAYGRRLLHEGRVGRERRRRRLLLLLCRYQPIHVLCLTSAWGSGGYFLPRV